ncbi:MAG TPA: type III PLP-dependent enzyme [Candidatus Saccharimonadales bacterium]|nr:type III PLP-dependent enzyme [Candidatus Saccharimonadales bacterium]
MKISKNILKNKEKKSDSIFEPSYLENLKYPTPFFIFSREKIVDNYKQFKKLFPKSAVHYAMKANSEPELLSILKDAGSGFEVASKFELKILHDLKVPPEKIIYGSSVKPADHIQEFNKYGVNRFACDSFAELEKIAVFAPGSKIYIRTVANDSGSVFKFSSKFGVDIDMIIPLLKRSILLGLKPYGISFHVGSQASDSKAWANMLSNLKSTIQELERMKIKLDIINIGGGFPCKYMSSEVVPDLDQIAKLILNEYEKLPYKPDLILEPGRAIIADTSVAVASIIARIERRGTTWLFLDAGCYNSFFETMAYQGSTRYVTTSIKHVDKSGEALFAIAGPTGDSPDIISSETLLPADIDVGDKLILHSVGAYSLSVASSFNGFPKPKAYFI